MKGLGTYAEKVLLCTLPWMVFGAFALMVYLVQDQGGGYRADIVFNALELISRFCVCIALGTVLADIAERKYKKTE